MRSLAYFLASVTTLRVRARRRPRRARPLEPDGGQNPPTVDLDGPRTLPSSRTNSAPWPARCAPCARRAGNREPVARPRGTDHLTVARGRDVRDAHDGCQEHRPRTGAGPHRTFVGLEVERATLALAGPDPFRPTGRACSAVVKGRGPAYHRTITWRTAPGVWHSWPRSSTVPGSTAKLSADEVVMGAPVQG